MTRGWTADRLPDLSGTTALVTGANSGIGLHTARQLAAHGARVVLGVRKVEAGEAVARDMVNLAGEVSVVRLDLASQRSVRELAAGWTGPLDLLVNNAGVMTPPRYRETEDGHELQMGTNHLGHFALAGRLLPHLLRSDHPRVVTVSSIAHHRGDASVLQGNPESDYSPHKAYGNSKLANLLFARELHRRATEAGSPLVSVASHPGVAATGLVSNPDGMGANPVVRRLLPPLLKLVLPRSATGALASLYASVEAPGGSYWGPTGIQEARGPVGEAKVSAHARDTSLAGDLWSRSEELSGVTYAFD